MATSDIKEPDVVKGKKDADGFTEYWLRHHVPLTDQDFIEVIWFSEWP